MQGSSTFVSLNSRLESNTEEEQGSPRVLGVGPPRVRQRGISLSFYLSLSPSLLLSRSLSHALALTLSLSLSHTRSYYLALSHTLFLSFSLSLSAYASVLSERPRKVDVRLPVNGNSNSMARGRCTSSSRGSSGFGPVGFQ